MKTEHSVSVMLVGEYDIQDRLTLRAVFRKRGWKLLETRDLNRAMHQLDRDCVPVVMVEFNPQDSTWRGLLEHLQHRGHPTQVVVTSRTADIGLWAEVLKLGGYDLLLSQPLDPAELEHVTASAARHGMPLRPECRKNEAGGDTTISEDQW